MAPPSRPAATSSSARLRAQPSARPPYSQEYVDAHPERCLAPRLNPISLPEETRDAWQPSSHVTYPTTYAPTRTGRGMGGALRLEMVPHAQIGNGPAANAFYGYHPPPYPFAYPPPYPPAYPIVNTAPAVPSAFPTTPVPSFSVSSAPLAQSSSIPIPKPRQPTSPPTPDPSPGRSAAIRSPRKRASTGQAQHGPSHKT